MGGLQQALTRVSEVRQGCISGLNFLHLDCLNLSRDEMNHFYAMLRHYGIFCLRFQVLGLKGCRVRIVYSNDRWLELLRSTIVDCGTI